MNALAISDIVVPFIYSPQVRERFSSVKFVISCGDMPYSYQEYIVSSLDVPLYYVRGNHDKEIEYDSGGARSALAGGIDLHRRAVKYQRILIAGVEGSLRYRDGPYQYSQLEMWSHVLSLTPRLVRNRMIYGRYLDVFVTHAPPRGIHDMDDLTHQGIDAFRWFIHVFHPYYHLHGHIHVIKPGTITETLFDRTKVVNVYGFREIPIEIADKGIVP
ncbi:MAG: hypothetical protein A2W33_06605 [Chloroflexi bacterium RBG_16_52_11]|nr:MAG: hypothetical protein A2W33_06605 [Chloroflexi bacterium RBG_16_52_11]